MRYYESFIIFFTIVLIIVVTELYILQYFEHLCAYEKNRETNIKDNKQILQNLGFLSEQKLNLLNHNFYHC